MAKYLLFFFVFIAPFTISAQEEPINTEQFVRQIDNKIPQLLEDFSVPGAAIAIIENGEIVLQKGYGFSDVEKEIKVSTETGFNIGSISKTIAAWGIMRLVHEGKIDLDAPAENYLSRWHLPESAFNSNEVTIRRLLSHTAGLSLHGYPGWSPSDDLPTIEASLNGENNGPGRVEIIMEPGTEYKYSGGGYSILQLIIEEVSGQKFEDYMQSQVLNPLGMANSSYKIDDRIMAASASEYDDFGEVIDFELFTAQAAAGLHATLEDFTRFALASLYRHEDHGKYAPILPAYIIQQMMEPVPEADGFFGYGMGYQVDQVQSMVLGGHGGDNTGWHAIFRVNPATNNGFLALTNGGRGSTICYQMYCDWVDWKTGVPLGDWCQIQPPISNKLKSIIDSSGVVNITEIYTELSRNQSDIYDFSESQLNDLGYYYLGKDDLETATAILQLNVEAFPNAFNVYDSYGEVLLIQGAREEAIENYTKSVRLNPANEHGISVLNELGVSTDELIEGLSVAVDATVLAGYVGSYQTSTGETITINKSEDQLIAELQEQQLNLIAQSTARFHVLGEESIVTFFTAATGQKGLWVKERIWRKLPDTPSGGSDNTVTAQHSTGDFLVFRNKSSWNRLTDFENVLVELGSNYEQRESSTMADHDLSSYDVIIIPGAQNSNYYNDYVSNLERFDEFVANGGTLVLELNGAEQNKSIILPLGVTIMPHKAIENAILESDHPIFFPLSGKRLIRARYASNGYLQNVPSNALILAVEVEGTDTFADRPTFIEYPYGEGRVIAASQCFHDRDDSGRGPLMESVISYALIKSWAAED